MPLYFSKCFPKSLLSWKPKWNLRWPLGGLHISLMIGCRARQKVPSTRSWASSLITPLWDTVSAHSLLWKVFYKALTFAENSLICGTRTLGFLGNYHRAPANPKVLGDVTEMKYLKVSQKLLREFSSLAHLRCKVTTTKILQTFSYFSSWFSFARSSGVGCVLLVMLYFTLI